MPRPKTKFGQKKLYYLEDETIEEISKNAGLMGLSDSAYLDFLVKKEMINTNPTKNISNLQKEKEKLKADIKLIEEKEKKSIEEMNKLFEWQQTKKIRKEEALKILEGIIGRGEFDFAESVAKKWQTLTGIPAIELLMEAKGKLRGGVTK